MKLKKSVSISGNVCLPLEVDQPAFVYFDGGGLRTSKIVSVGQVTDELIQFETLNSIYSISPVPVLTPSDHTSVTEGRGM